MSRLSAPVEGFLELTGIDPRIGDPGLLEQVSQEYRRFPYENATKLIRLARGGEPRDWLRSPEVLLREHRDRGAGGTCFSLTWYLRGILQELGFEPRIVMADMQAGANLHCALLVPAGGEAFLLDPGYLMRRPLRLPERLDSEEDGVQLAWAGSGPARSLDISTQEAQGLKWRYRVRLAPVDDRTFRSHWIDSFQRMNSLVVTRRIGRERLYVHGRFMRETRPEGHRNHRLPKNGYGQAVERRTGLRAELVEEAHAAWRTLRDDG